MLEGKSGRESKAMILLCYYKDDSGIYIHDVMDNQETYSDGTMFDWYQLTVNHRLMCYYKGLRVW